MIYLDLELTAAFSIPPVWSFDSYYSPGPAKEIEIIMQANAMKMQQKELTVHTKLFKSSQSFCLIASSSLTAFDASSQA